MQKTNDHYIGEWVKFVIDSKQKYGKIIDILRGAENRIIVYTVLTNNGNESYTIAPKDILIKKQKSVYPYATSIFYC
jgi:hypothetical protein